MPEIPFVLSDWKDSDSKIQEQFPNKYFKIKFCPQLLLESSTWVNQSGIQDTRLFYL